MRLRIDLRDQSPQELTRVMAKFPASVSFMITAWQWSVWSQANQASGSCPVMASRIVVVCPDFLNYARLISTGQARKIFRLPASTRRLMLAGLNSFPTGFSNLMGLAKGEFWAGAEAMLAYDIGLLPRKFEGEVLLHYNLADFAGFFDKDGFLRSFASLAKKATKWGICTQQLPTTLSMCSRNELPPDRIIYMTGYSRPKYELVKLAATRQFQKTEWTIDLTQWPLEQFGDLQMHDFERELDSEWLVNLQTAIQLYLNNFELIN